MKLFLITGVPLYLILFFSIFFSGAVDFRLALRSAARGILWFFPAIVVYSFVTGFFPQAFEGGPLYFVRTFSDLLFPLALGLGTYMVSYRRELIVPGDLQFVRLITYLTGFFTFFAQYVLFSFSGWYEGYTYFLLPLLWMVLMAVEGFVVGGFFSIVRNTRFFLLAFGIALPFSFGWIAYLYLNNYRLSAWLVTLIVFGLSFPVMSRTLPVLKR